MEPVLTQEELEAIYSAMKADGGPPKAVDDYVLASDHAYAQRSLRTWDALAKAMGPLMEPVLIGSAGVRTKLDALELRTIEDDREPDDGSYRPDSSLQEPRLLETDPDFETSVVDIGGVRMLMGIERPVAQKYVARRTGASSEGEGAEGNRAPALTWLERRLLADLFQELLTAASPALPGGATPVVDRQDTDDFWRHREPRGLWIDARIMNDVKPGASIWLRGPADAFSKKIDGAPAGLVETVKRTKVEISAELGRFTMKVFDLWNLTPGTVIPLGTAVDDALDVFIGGVNKLKGEPMVSRGNIAVRLGRRADDGVMQ